MTLEINWFAKSSGYALIACIFGVLCSLLSPVSHAADNSVIGLRVGSVEIGSSVNKTQAGSSQGADGTALRVVVETRNPANASLKLLSEPYRLVIDIPDADWQVNGVDASGNLAKPPAIEYRFGKPQPDIGRIVIELSDPAIPVRKSVLVPQKGSKITGHRLILDLVNSGRAAFQLTATALNQDGTRLPAPGVMPQRKPAFEIPSSSQVTAPTPKPQIKSAAEPPTPAKKPETKKWVVFIDAGHGGKDPGAIGTRKTKEKEITLSASLELARQLQATGVITPVLSRKDDRYLKLRERIRRARDQESDVFISLHADAAPSSKARGISIFTLSDTASDKEAALLAKNENKADLIGGPDLSVEDPEAAEELLRMFQREAMNQSTFLANAILREIRDMPGGDKRGHRFAGFAVLKAPDMPAVLVEMGFITNREDEANLIQSSYRKRLVERLARAILAYLNEYGPR